MSNVPCGDGTILKELFIDRGYVYEQWVGDSGPYTPSPAAQRHIDEMNVISSTISELLGVKNLGPVVFSMAWQGKYLLPALPDSIVESTKNLFGVQGYIHEVARLILIYKLINMLKAQSASLILHIQHALEEELKGGQQWQKT